MELATYGIWQTKRNEAFKGLKRIAALAEFGRAGYEEASHALENAFLTENPVLWRFAAKTILKWKKKGKDIHLKNPERIRELIERDPLKFQKIMQPLL